MLAALWDQFATESRQHVDVLEDTVAGLLAGAFSAEQHGAAERAAHRLSGSMGTFGLSEGSRLGREAETLPRGGIDLEDVARLASITTELRRALEQAQAPAVLAEADGEAHQPTIDARVIVVDDDPVVLDLVDAILTREGAQVRRLADPTRLIAALAAEPPDLLLLDGDMPGLDGVALCRGLRADPRWAALPIVLLTAPGDAAGVQAAFDAGADDCIAKPIAAPELITRLRNRLERARALGGPSAVPGPAAAAAATPGMTVDVVLVDDDEPLSRLLLHALGTRGYSTMWLTNGADAVEALAGAAPRLRGRVLLLDVNLPGLDGIGVLRRLATDGVVAGARVIMLTARSSEAEILKTLELGASEHVSKPFSVSVLIQRIRRALES